MGEKDTQKKLIFSSVSDEVRVGLLENEELTEIFFEDMEAGKNSGKIFCGRIENEVPSLEAFFVNIGMKKNGFLRYKDILGLPNEYKRGDFLVVQVRKDGNTRKGPLLSMQINIPGKYIVYIPDGEGSIGISRKISEHSERERIREIAEDVIHESEGIIFRTNCQGIDKQTIVDELKELRDNWHKIALGYKESKKPTLLFSDDDFIEYILRERVDNTIREIITDDLPLHKRIRKILADSEFKPVIRNLNKDAFALLGIYNQMNDIFARKIELKSGGTITIDRTEAMTVVDVDSASNVRESNVEDTSFLTNKEAAIEICRQMRLRNLAGIILVDFIDMHKREHHESIIRMITEESKRDKARVTVVGFTNLGLLEITRKRTTAAIDSILFSPCPICHGTGRVASPAVVFNRIVKDIEDSVKDLEEDDITEIHINVYHNLSGYATPEKRIELEQKYNIKIKFEFNWNDPNTYNMRFRK